MGTGSVFSGLGLRAPDRGSEVRRSLRSMCPAGPRRLASSPAWRRRGCTSACAAPRYLGPPPAARRAPSQRGAQENPNPARDLATQVSSLVPRDCRHACGSALERFEDGGRPGGGAVAGDYFGSDVAVVAVKSVLGRGSFRERAPLMEDAGVAAEEAHGGSPVGGPYGVG